ESQRGTNGHVEALTVFDDGEGPALYAGGDFTEAGGVAANHVARWDGSRWSALGSGTSAAVRALVVFDDGSGPALYAGGSFQTAGGGPVKFVGRWDCSSWTALGSGTGGIVRALVVFDDGNGPALHAGGDFTSAGGAPANRIAKWDGSSWENLGSGVNGLTLPSVNVLAVFDDGNGAALYVGGAFGFAGGLPCENLARWDGSSWSGLGTPPSGGYVHALTVFDDGGGSALYAGG